MCTKLLYAFIDAEPRDPDHEAAMSYRLLGEFIISRPNDSEIEERERAREERKEQRKIAREEQRAQRERAKEEEREQRERAKEEEREQRERAKEGEREQRERQREARAARSAAERERLNAERAARLLEETIQRMRGMIEEQRATIIADVVQRLNDSEARNAREREELLATMADRIQEAVAADREANPRVQPVDIHAMAAHQQELEERRVAMVERMGTFQKILYYFDRQSLLVKMGLIGLGIAACAGAVYVVVYTPLGARLISLVSNASSALPAAAEAGSAATPNMAGILAAGIALGATPRASN